VVSSNSSLKIFLNFLKNVVPIIRLDKHWKDEELYYANYKADISGSHVTYREIEEIQESGEEEPWGSSASLV
jgi:hypothetical protein